MATLGKIDEFVPITGDWMHHIEWMNQAFVSSNITEETKNKAILLSSNGAGTYS